MVAYVYIAKFLIVERSNETEIRNHNIQLICI